VVNKQRRRVGREALARLARKVMEAEGCPRGTELSVVIGDDRWIQSLNKKYRKRNAPTDVLAFPQGRGPMGTEHPRASALRASLMGDVAVSAETAARQAKALGHKLQEELAVLMVHGILHLTGWQDKTPKQRRAMMRRTQELLAQVREGSSVGRTPEGAAR